MLPSSLKFKRVLLKLSGEALQGQGEFGIDHMVLEQIVREVSEAKSYGVDIAIVIGGGNIFRGASLSKVGMDHATADYVGMLATIMNAMVLQETFRFHGVDARAMSALNIEAVVEPYIRGKAIRYLESGTIVIFAAGTGNPFFTTDTAAALRATEIGADVLLKATKVDGVYSKDPVRHSDAIFYPTVSFQQALEQDLKVMDATALALCRDQSLPIFVFSLFRPGALLRVLRGEEEGTLVHCSSDPE